MTDTSLSTRCLTLATLGRDALSWLKQAQNAERVGPEKKSMTRTLRRAVRRATRLGMSAQTRMSVSVFGPSQAGKSFLVSVLARPADGRLVADFGGTELDYIRELNPEGEGESTGLVTRFTTARDPVPAGFPIRLSLLSEADLARVLANSFYMDGDKSEPAPERDDLKAHLAAFAPRAAAQPLPGLSYEEIIEIGEYVEANFARQSAYASALKSFWDEAAALAPHLGPQDRAEFLSILWGRHGEMTRLFGELAASLAQIGHASDVHVGLDAVTPRENSILDVKALSDVLNPAALNDQIALLTASGLRTQLPRARICALAAELVLPMRDVPHPLFATTDLLDFPGARNRFNKALSVTLADPENLSGLLLRGKVAYLFDRYVENQEITSMLLCVPDSNMETVDLPRLVSTWISQTHGSQPRQRAKMDCILFFVLTKFDKHLSESAAAGGDTSRFQRRMEASLLEKFTSGTDNWVERWTPDAPFKNCFWLRNPNFYVDGLLDYSAERREARIRPDKEARMAELREGCLRSEAVQRHFHDPAAAWDAAMALNDGGVAHLVQALTQVCKPDQKLRQIGQQAERVVRDLHATLSPYYTSTDIDARLAQAEEISGAVIDDLALALESHRFGAVLAGLMVDPDEVTEQIRHVPSTIRIGTVVSASTAAPVGGVAKPGPARPGAGPARPARPRASAAPARALEPSAETGAASVRTLTLEGFQAEQTIQLWIERMKAFRDSPALREACGLRTQSAQDLVAALIHAAARTGLASRIAAALRQLNHGHTVERVAAPAAILAAEMVNGFVATLGTADLPEDARPQVTPEAAPPRPVFAARPLYNSAAGLPEAPRPTTSLYWEDWVFSLHHVLIENAMDENGVEIDVEQNRALGRILEGIGAPEDAS